MSVTFGLSWFVRSKAQLEQDIVSVERIEGYCNTDQEKAYDTPHDREELLRNWPSNGQIQFNNVYMKYRTELPFVLKGITFDIQSGEKIGIIGRTGAGKSTLFLTILRLIEIDNEHLGINDNSDDNYMDEQSKFELRQKFINNPCRITIDGIDISTIGLHTLRSRISVIPQDPILFTGTVRFNLDPFDTKTDKELIAALKNARSWKNLQKMAIKIYQKRELDLKMEDDSKSSEVDDEYEEPLLSASAPAVNASIAIDILSKESSSNDDEKYGNPLDIEVEENGGNFSVGQRQLLCLARAIVRDSQILLLDEATSAVDPATDQLIQNTIRTVFSEQTILTIAHRIDTILDYDKILILELGNILEYNSPRVLLADENSKFSEIVQASFGVNLNDVLQSKALFVEKDDDGGLDGNHVMEVDEEKEGNGQNIGVPVEEVEEENGYTPPALS